MSITWVPVPAGEVSDDRAGHRLVCQAGGAGAVQLKGRLHYDDVLDVLDVLDPLEVVLVPHYFFVKALGEFFFIEYFFCVAITSHKVPSL